MGKLNRLIVILLLSLGLGLFQGGPQSLAQEAPLRGEIKAFYPYQIPHFRPQDRSILRNAVLDAMSTHDALGTSAWFWLEHKVAYPLEATWHLKPGDTLTPMEIMQVSLFPMDTRLQLNLPDSQNIGLGFYQNDAILFNRQTGMVYDVVYKIL